MSDQYLRILREEVKSKAISSIPRTRLDGILQVYRKAFSSIPWLPPIARESLRVMLEKVLRDVDSLATARLVKIIVNKQYDQNSIDGELGKTLISILEVEKTLLSPLTVRYGEKYSFRFNTECQILGKTYRRGELAMLSQRELMMAMIEECGVPFTQPIWRGLNK
jgi:hypothetical protein